MERAVFLSKILKRSVREVESFWIGQKLYTGDSSPVQVDSGQTIISLISRFPGAIGYTSSVPEEGKGVKIIQVNGPTP